MGNIGLITINTSNVVYNIRTSTTTGHPHKQRVWLFVRNIKKCMENIGESYYSKIISRNV